MSSVSIPSSSGLLMTSSGAVMSGGIFVIVVARMFGLPVAGLTLDLSIVMICNGEMAMSNW